MRNEAPSLQYTFVVDTDSYAGNFERDLCAYMTGLVGDCGVGEEAAKLYTDDGFEPLEDLVTSVPDEHGCWRPASIFTSPGWFNDGYGSHFKLCDYDETQALTTRNQAIERQALDTEKVYKDKDYGKAEADKLRLNKERPLQKFPAYNSVAVFLSRAPSEEEIKFLKERANKYGQDTRKKNRFSGLSFDRSFNIEGFRLVTEEIVTKSVNL